MKRYINLLLAFGLSAFTLQSCFQDMDHPAFDYPDSSAGKEYSPMKLFLPFENDMRDKGNYTFLMSAGLPSTRAVSFIDSFTPICDPVGPR